MGTLPANIFTHAFYHLPLSRAQCTIVQRQCRLCAPDLIISIWKAALMQKKLLSGVMFNSSFHNSCPSTTVCGSLLFFIYFFPSLKLYISPPSPCFILLFIHLNCSLFHFVPFTLGSLWSINQSIVPCLGVVPLSQAWPYLFGITGHILNNPAPCGSVVSA